jgi:hypothetical protein
MTNVHSVLNLDPQIRIVRHSCIFFITVPTLPPLGIELSVFFFSPVGNELEKKLCYMCGISRNGGDDKYICILTSLLINYTMWQFKLKKNYS